ncbi:ABC transporter substrate-binding protein [Microbacterium sorbitolivorans]|uniref:Extracellular solute-binding protein n=1 Tax=Microbacterium sorbitolivorans TaxID=1867410 RepID=A0A367YA92_9MICO|nr:ABC transporter substrate-binding protein [Microbacterium sorbitolivorans]RCK61942.1 extracellular solute-binding protein [Microbacterium sorbitolivorans]GGF44443.1 ABC transporter substrate-binding protein [Microbacterium sorbitolivorans]
MSHFPRSLRLAAGIAVMATAAVSLAACSSDDNAADSEAASATSLADFGTLEDLEAAAKEEGALNVIALPRDWANYGAILDLFAERYPEITINEASPDVSSAEEIQAAETNAGTDKAPDVFDLGLTVALQNVDSFAAYKVEGFDDIPESLKDPEGRFVGDYGGYMSVGVDTSKFPAPAEISDLTGSDYKGAVAINGDPTQAGAAFAAVGLASILNDGSLDDFQPGIDFFGELNSAGNFLKVDVTPATVASGETPVVFDWDYLNAAYTADNPDWEVVVFPDLGYASYYNQAINADAPHPAAARLWQEFLYSDEVQNLFLAGGARPARMDAMTDAGTIDADLAAALPEVPAETLVPTQEQSDAAGTLLGEKWAAAVQ